MHGKLYKTPRGDLPKDKADALAQKYCDEAIAAYKTLPGDPIDRGAVVCALLVQASLNLRGQEFENYCHHVKETHNLIVLKRTVMEMTGEKRAINVREESKRLLELFPGTRSEKAKKIVGVLVYHMEDASRAEAENVLNNVQMIMKVIIAMKRSDI